MNLRNSASCFQVAPPLEGQQIHALTDTDTDTHSYMDISISLEEKPEIHAFFSFLTHPSRIVLHKWVHTQFCRAGGAKRGNKRAINRSKEDVWWTAGWSEGQTRQSGGHSRIIFFSKKHANWSWLRPPWGLCISPGRWAAAVSVCAACILVSVRYVRGCLLFD